MSEHPNRDQIAELLASLTLPDEESWHEWRYETADALIAAGLVVPAGLTAEKLRSIAQDMVDEQNGAGDEWWRDDISELRAWADVLELRETPE